MSKAARPDNAPINADSDAAPASGGRTGPQVIAGYVRRLPMKPGVYRMYGAGGEILYVGKAKRLKARVSSYARSGGHTNRIARMIALTASMEFVVTDTEIEALLLEANLIKRLKPRFNIILRDDKSFPYILIRGGHPAPQLMKHRGARKIEGEYFGPFAGAGAVNETLNTLQKAFLLRTCADSVYEQRTRPCMLHQIKRCSAPCVGYIDEARYGELVDEAKAFLRGRSNALRERLQAEMNAASEALDYERAARLRDRIRAIAAVTARQGINVEGMEEADIAALHQEGERTCIQVFFFRAGQNWGNRAFYPRHEADAEPGDILAAFLAQFYDNKPAPALVLVSHEPAEAGLLAEALSMRSDRAVEIRKPVRGPKKKLVEQAVSNAREALGRQLAETRSQARLLEGVARAFGLEAPPQRIEVYDNSHLQGSNALGAMIAAGPEGFEKTAYRRFNMKGEDAATNDDYAMMRAMMRRRFARLAKDRHEGAPVPDLVLIDGGKGQLSAVMEVMAELGLDIPLAAVAKGPDRDAGREVFYLPGRAPLRLPVNDPVLYYLQRLRDEAHRYAVTGHRAGRTRQMRSNPLDAIAGIGAARKSALLKHFGSAKAVSSASLADLEGVEGISTAMAKKIHDHFHD